MCVLYTAKLFAYNALSALLHHLHHAIRHRVDGVTVATLLHGTHMIHGAMWGGRVESRAQTSAETERLVISSGVVGGGAGRCICGPCVCEYWLGICRYILYVRMPCYTLSATFTCTLQMRWLRRRNLSIIGNSRQTFI